jgi:hypothetical protein
MKFRNRDTTAALAFKPAIGNGRTVNQSQSFPSLFSPYQRVSMVRMFLAL